ncbi:MAG: hypothetical protein K9H25_17290 [Rhodospirillum sp.]|nr:hypothetical protein [Rhodospirillum sp.]MCF8502110.1 hypothetical protein [Rhodospirillum sp.]
MHDFKLKAGSPVVKEITKRTFEQDTGRRAPWYQVNERSSGPEKGRRSQYAVCPLCDNPIQIIGLYHRPKNTDHPYGRHSGKPIPGFDHFDVEELRECPYIRKRKPTKSSRREKLSGIPLTILGIIHTRFPEIIRTIELDTGIQFSVKLAEKFLTAYMEERGYLYTGATPRNTPWMVAYFSDSQSLFGQSLFGNQAFSDAIREHVPDARFDNDGRLAKGGRYYEINCCFIDHGQIIVNRELKETMEFQGRQAAAPFHRQVIQITPQRFETMTTTGFPPWKTQQLQEAAHRILSKHLGPAMNQLEALPSNR